MRDIIHKTAKEAMEHSETHDTIAYCEDNEDNRSTLLAEADMWGHADGESEYWKSTEGSEYEMDWRVHILED